MTQSEYFLSQQCSILSFYKLRRVANSVISYMTQCVEHNLTHCIDVFLMCKHCRAESREKAPVCVLLCLCSSSLRVNLFPQNIQLQTKGRSPECQRRCARRCDVFPYTFPQPAMWQMCCFFFPVLDPLRERGMKSYGFLICLYPMQS